SGPQSMAEVNGTLFFAADDGMTGRELWKTDGTPEGTVLVKDINPNPIDPDPTASDSDPGDLTNVNGTLFFFAKEPAHGDELWKSDGTGAGTARLTDINPGPGSSQPFDRRGRPDVGSLRSSTGRSSSLRSSRTPGSSCGPFAAAPRW